MKLIQKNEETEKEEALLEERKRIEKEHYDASMKDFRESPAYRYVLEIFDKSEKKIVDKLEAMQYEEMKKLYMLPLKEQREKLVSMSKRDTILTGIRAVLKQIRERI